MPTPKQTRFTAYDFTEEEMKSASVLNPLQKMFIQTQVANIAQQVLNLDAADRKELADFEIQRAYLKGQMEVLEHLLELSAAMELNIQEEQADASNSFVVTQQSLNLYTRNEE